MLADVPHPNAAAIATLESLAECDRYFQLILYWQVACLVRDFTKTDVHSIPRGCITRKAFKRVHLPP
ncbi:MAG TPA: hypothetical protein V6D11_16855 [Waterburya sp.]